MSISVLAPTNRESNVTNIIANFSRQNYQFKELIILLNYDNPDEGLIRKLIDENKDISYYILGSRTTIGGALNYGLTKSKYDYIAKMDDDDYYGENYLENSLNALFNNNADIVGKTSIFIYFINEDILGLKYSSYENKQVRRVVGSTLFFRKYITSFIKFEEKNLAEDRDFCKYAIKMGFKIYSTDRNDYIYFRKNNYYHTWKINNEYLLKKCIYLKVKPDLDRIMKLWQV